MFFVHSQKSSKKILMQQVPIFVSFLNCYLQTFLIIAIRKNWSREGEETKMHKMQRAAKRDCASRRRAGRWVAGVENVGCGGLENHA